jgi:hypothetical protein
LFAAAAFSFSKLQFTYAIFLNLQLKRVAEKSLPPAGAQPTAFPLTLMAAVDAGVS